MTAGGAGGRRPRRRAAAGVHGALLPGSRPLVVLCLIGLLGGSGCSMVPFAPSVVREISRTAWGEYTYQLSDSAIRKRISRWANEALLAHTDETGAPVSSDFERGFHAGFKHLVMTGSPEAPALPPTRYLSARYVSPEGVHATKSWYAGYQAGANSALQGGYRQLVTLPAPSHHYSRDEAGSWNAPETEFPTTPDTEEIPSALPEEALPDGLGLDLSKRDSQGSPIAPAAPRHVAWPQGEDVLGNDLPLIVNEVRQPLSLVSARPTATTDPARRKPLPVTGRSREAYSAYDYPRP